MKQRFCYPSLVFGLMCFRIGNADAGTYDASVNNFDRIYTDHCSCGCPCDDPTCTGTTSQIFNDHDFGTVPRARPGTMVSIHVTAKGDLGGANKFHTVFFNDASPPGATVFQGDTCVDYGGVCHTTCPPLFSFVRDHHLQVTADYYNTRREAGSRTMRITLGASCDVIRICAACSDCPGFGQEYTTVRLLYDTACASSADCDDGLYCTIDTCNVGTGECSHSSRNCSDGNPCTTDSCNETSNQCDHAPNSNSCNDGVFCNGTDTCSGGSCSIHAGDPCSSGCCDETNDGCELAIDWSEPPDGAIDARQPSKPDGSDPAGWDSINITMTGAAGAIAADDFSLTVDPQGTAPDIADVSVDGNVVTLELAGFIPTGKWTQFTHDCSGTSVCLGYLPADVSNDRTSAPNDILWVIDCINGVRTCEIWQCDADRNGVCGPPDIMRVIDLLNGAGVYDVWLNVSIPLLSPCEAGGESATGGGAGGDLSELALSEVEPADAAASDADFVDGFLTLLTIGPWADDFAAMDIRAIVEALTDWAVVHTPVQERFALAEQLQDPTLTFANAVVAEMIPWIIAALVE
ncbi:MAG: hypothetical protein JSU86_09680 [Phycisphaerales bacterium]|nr:MAG: hypothetical protein JSU86_09680 [Phycisphaerales bacterium]